MLSPDEDFSQTGANSGIKYAESFKKYKEMLTEHPESPTFKRIFSEFNVAVFGTIPTPSDDLVAGDSDYDSELEQFKNGLLEDSPIQAVGDVEVNETFSPSLSPAPTPQPEGRISVSVVSHVSHTIAATSQVSNVISSNVSLPSGEHGVSDTSPPVPKAARPAPKKKGAKLSKSTTSTSNANADTNTVPIPIPSKRGTAPQPKVASVEHPTRTLRKRH